MPLLESHDIQYFETFGFLHLRAIFSPEEVGALSASAEEIWRQDASERGFTGAERQQVNGFVERDRSLYELIADDRVFETAKSFLGRGMVWIGSDGNRYTGDTGWHPDGSNFSYKRIKFAIYLDVLTASSGAIRVIPGSHLPGLHEGLRVLLQRDDETITPYGVKASKRNQPGRSGFGSPPSDVPAWAIETTPGDLVVFNQNIWHSSFGGRSGRRMFTLNFGEAPKNEADQSFLREMYSGQLEHVQERQWIRRAELYGQHFLSSDNPRIAAVVRSLLALDMR